MHLGLATDAANPNFIGATNPDSALHVTFYVKPCKNDFETKKQGRPIFEDKTYVRIHTPGNQLSVIDVPARPDHMARFPLQWAHFKNNQNTDGQVGTPISQWAILTPSQVEMLHALKFYTVEQIAFSSDQQINGIGMLAGMGPFAFRDRAKIYLAGAKGDSEQAKMAEALEAERKARQEAEERHAREIAELRALIEGKATIAPRPIEEAPPKIGTPEAEEVMERSQLAMAYEVKFGKKPHHKLGIEKIREALNG